MKNSVKLLLALIGIAASLSLSASPIQKGKMIAKNQEYKVPGATLINIAKRHGYEFDVPFRSMFSKCEFMGMHWVAPPHEKCILVGFYSNKTKCQKLRHGWKIKSVTMNGPGTWDTRPFNTSEPLTIMISDNTHSKAKSVSIKDMTLVGPAGPRNNWQAAFTHCSQANYR